MQIVAWMKASGRVEPDSSIWVGLVILFLKRSCRKSRRAISILTVDLYGGMEPTWPRGGLFVTSTNK